MRALRTALALIVMSLVGCGGGQTSSDEHEGFTRLDNGRYDSACERYDPPACGGAFLTQAAVDTERERILVLWREEYTPDDFEMHGRLLDYSGRPVAEPRKLFDIGYKKADGSIDRDEEKISDGYGELRFVPGDRPYRYRTFTRRYEISPDLQTVEVMRVPRRPGLATKQSQDRHVTERWPSASFRPVPFSYWRVLPPGGSTPVWISGDEPSVSNEPLPPGATVAPH